MDFKIVSSNIRFESDKDAEHHWNYRKPILSQYINEFSPDILATQEGQEPQIKDLLSSLNDLKICENHRNWIKERMYPTIFFSKNIHILKSGDIWLSKTPSAPGSKSFESMFPRLCTWIEATHKKTGLHFLFINTHLDHVKEITRIQQAKVLIKEISTLNKNNLPIIIAGDFNSSPKKEVHQSLIKNLELYDPWLKENKKEEGSFHKFDGKNENNSRIDWILCNKNIKSKNIFMDKNCENNIYPSDHFIIKLTL